MVVTTTVQEVDVRFALRNKYTNVTNNRRQTKITEGRPECVVEEAHGELN